MEPLTKQGSLRERHPNRNEGREGIGHVVVSIFIAMLFASIPCGVLAPEAVLFLVDVLADFVNWFSVG